MNTTRELIPEMTLEDFAKKHDLTLEIRERNLGEMSHLTENDRFYASFKGVEVKDGSILISSFGNGATEHDAVADYKNQISLKRLVKSAYSNSRVDIEPVRII